MTLASLPRPPCRASRRGFTMIELIVAMGAGMFVALAALILSRNATKFFQSEARIAGAQLGATLGMNRLTADLARAGFLTTPNGQRDPHVCDTRSQWPAGLAKLSAITLYQAGSVAAHPADLVQSTDPANGFQPDSVVIAGALDATEAFPVGAVGPEAGGFGVHLQVRTGPVQRAIAAGDTGGSSLKEIFRAGRFLRLAGPLGQEIYGVIQSVTPTGTPVADVLIVLANTPPILIGGSACAIGGHGTGNWTANPVSRVRYDLRSLAGDAHYGALVAAQAAQVVSGDDKRTELVRVELDANDNEMPDTLELVAELAVDLKFGLRSVNGVAAGTNPTVGQRYPIQAGVGNAQVYTIAGDVSTNAAATPQLVRSVQVRLATRARVPDRDSDLGAPAADGHRARMFIPTGSPRRLYARVRTLYDEVTLQNLAGETW
jgi:prepilin-type N-terminal cleavage/methylation domain-containing protein